MSLYNLLWVISLQILLNKVSSYGPRPYYGDYNNFPPWQSMQPLYEGPPNIPPRFPDLGAPAPQIIRPIIPERTNNEPVNISHGTDVLGVVSKLAPHVKPVVNIQYQGPVNFYNIYKANNGAETRNETTAASENLASLVKLLKYVNGQLDRFVPNTTEHEQNSATTLQVLNKTIIAAEQLAPATTQPTVHVSEAGSLYSGAEIQKPNNPLYTSEYHEKDPAVTHETQHNLYLSSDIHGTKPFVSNYEVPSEHLFLSGNESDLKNSEDSPPFLSTHKENRATNTLGDELYLSKISEHKTRSARSVKYEDNPNKRWGKLGFLFRKTRQVFEVPANQNSFGLPAKSVDFPPTVAPSKLILNSEDFAPSTTTTIDSLLSNLSALPENRENTFRNSATQTGNGLSGIPAQFEQIPASVFRSPHRFSPKTIPDLDNYHLEMLIILNMRYAKIFQALKSDLSIPQEGTLKLFRQNLQNINRDQNFGPNFQNLALPTRNLTIAFKSVGGELFFDALPVRAAGSFRTNLKNINRDTNFRENFENFQTPDAKLTPFNRINIINSAPILSSNIQNLGPTTSFNFPKIDTNISVGNNFNNTPSNFNENNTFRKPETAVPNNQNASLLTQMIVNDVRRITNNDLLKLPEKNSSEFNLNQQNVNRDQFLVGDQIFQLPSINFGSNQTENRVNSLVINSEKISKNRAPKKLEPPENFQSGPGVLGVNTLINSVTETKNFENIGQIPLERHPIFDGDKIELTDSFGKPLNF